MEYTKAEKKKMMMNKKEKEGERVTSIGPGMMDKWLVREERGTKDEEERERVMPGPNPDLLSTTRQYFPGDK